jgi:hypothetical protein
MTADSLGIRVFLADGPVEIAKGDPRACPQCGTSEIEVGRIGKRRFIAAIEPWHGNQIVAYTESGAKWIRHVLEGALINGHALAVGDRDGDGRDEIVAGFRGKGLPLYVFRSEDTRGERWTRHTLDSGGMAAADCKIADFDRNRRAAVACSGAPTANVKLYRRP